MYMDNFLASYIQTALWSSTDEQGNALDSLRYAHTELAEETMKRMAADCESFKLQCAVIIDPTTPIYPVAHDFWLTRNRHGAGFWDGDYPDEIGTALTKLAHSFPECDLYVGDDGKFYL